MKRALVLAAALAMSCGNARTPHANGPARLELHVDARDGHAVRVNAHFTNGGSAELELPAETMRGLSSFEILRGGKCVATHTGTECVTDCTFRYAIDLDRVERSFEGVVAVGERAWIAPSPSWMAHPKVMPKGTYEITIDGPAEATEAFTAVPFATGLRRKDATHYAMSTGDYWEGSFAAFGELRHRVVEAAGSRIEVVLVSDTKLSLSDDEVARWVKEDAECVAQLYGHFPVDRATVFIVPIDGAREVVFGKVLSLGGSSIIALTGTELRAKDTHDDWVLVHEMTHLGFPTMGGVRWLTEGLATYYEPILRTRAGWRTRESLWDGFVRSMPRGLPKSGDELALNIREGIDASYWGGAIFMLMADVGIRRATNDEKSFDDVLRAILAKGGDATTVWTLPQVIDMARNATGTNVVGDLVDRLAVRGERVDLDAIWHELGVHHSEIHLENDAPGAAYRRGIEGQKR